MTEQIERTQQNGRTNLTEGVPTVRVDNLLEIFLISYGMSVIARHLEAYDMDWVSELELLGYTPTLITSCWLNAVNSIKGILKLTNFSGTLEEVQEVLKQYNG